MDSNHRSSAHEADEIDHFSTPHGIASGIRTRVPALKGQGLYHWTNATYCCLGFLLLLEKPSPYRGGEHVYLPRVCCANSNLVEHSGFEPLTFSLQGRPSTTEIMPHTYAPVLIRSKTGELLFLRLAPWSRLHRRTILTLRIFQDHERKALSYWRSRQDSNLWRFYPRRFSKPLV